MGGMSNEVVAGRVILSRFGVPSEGLSVEDVEVRWPGRGQVGVRLLAAPVNPSDLGVIGGTYGRLPELPAVPGREGVGEIFAVGSGVGAELLNKRVRMPVGLGSWQDFVIIEKEGLLFVPDGIVDEMAAMAFINPPTAWCMLHDFVGLKAGDWVIQNAGNSAVGCCVIQMARYLGIRTINVVRDMSWEGYLKEIGADVVVGEESGWEKDSGYASMAKLALNSVGGASGLRLFKGLGEGGVHVTFGGMAREGVVWPTRELIFRDIRVRGFALDRVRFGAPERYLEVLQLVFDLIRKGIIDIPVEKRYSLRDVKEAIEHAGGYHRKGKILLTSNWSPPTE